MAAFVICDIAYPTANPIGVGKANVANCAIFMAFSHGFAALDFWNVSRNWSHVA
jgi:hypothetical protein